MSLIPYTEFAKLRLHQFDPTAEKWEAGDNDSADYEFMYSLWYDQDSSSYVEFLRHEHDPHRVGVVTINLNCAPDLASRILTALQLPLRRDMTLQEVAGVLGFYRTLMKTGHDFICGIPDQYLVRCWFMDNGLRDVEIFRMDLLPDSYANNYDA